MRPYNSKTDRHIVSQYWATHGLKEGWIHDEHQFLAQHGIDAKNDGLEHDNCRYMQEYRDYIRPQSYLTDEVVIYRLFKDGSMYYIETCNEKAAPQLVRYMNTSGSISRDSVGHVIGKVVGTTMQYTTILRGE